MSDIKFSYVSSTDLVVSGLNALPSSSTHISGWESDEIDNSSNKYLDYLVSAKIAVTGASLTAGEIRLSAVAKLDDSTYPGGFDGVQGVETSPLDDENGTNAGTVFLNVASTDTTGGQVYYLRPVSVAAGFGGICPEKFVLFITQSTAQNLSSTGNQVTIKPVYLTVG